MGLKIGKPTSDRMPVVFIGHGNPMNAIAQNDFSQTLTKLGKELPTPRAILVVSAHWLTAGTWVTGMQKPRTIHDFYGFPEELFAVQYPAPGSPEVAAEVKAQVEKPVVHIDENSWGLDHGTWSVLRHVYPQANIPVIQLSIDMSEPPQFHLDLGQKLAKLRDQGVLIVGSGNIVHNLRQIRWGGDSSFAFDWATEFDEQVKQALLSGNHSELLTKLPESSAGRLSVPTPDHYYPLLYAVGAATKNEEPRFIYEGIEMGSISMRTLVYG